MLWALKKGSTTNERHALTCASSSYYTVHPIFRRSMFHDVIGRKVHHHEQLMSYQILVQSLLVNSSAPQMRAMCMCFSRFCTRDYHPAGSIMSLGGHAQRVINTTPGIPAPRRAGWRRCLGHDWFSESVHYVKAHNHCQLFMSWQLMIIAGWEPAVGHKSRIHKIRRQLFTQQ